MPDLETFLHELERLGDPVPKTRLLALVRSFAGQRIWFGLEAQRRDRLRLAAALLASGMDRVEAMQALTDRLQVSRATAYRLLRAAQESPP